LPHERGGVPEPLQFHDLPVDEPEGDELPNLQPFARRFDAQKLARVDAALRHPGHRPVTVGHQFVDLVFHVADRGQPSGDLLAYVRRLDGHLLASRRREVVEKSSAKRAATVAGSPVSHASKYFRTSRLVP